jgi:hypothetical protein
MTTIVTPAAYAASKTLASSGPSPTRSQLCEVIAALLGYQTYAALVTEEANASLSHHIDDAEILVLNKPAAAMRAAAIGIANIPTVVQACIDAIRGAVKPAIGVFVGVDDFYDTFARDRMVQVAIDSDDVSGAMADSNALFDDDPDFQGDTPATADLWQARTEWSIEANGDWVGSYESDAERMFNGDTLNCSAKLTYDKAGRSGLIASNSEAYANRDDSWSDQNYEAE